MSLIKVDELISNMSIDQKNKLWELHDLTSQLSKSIVEMRESYQTFHKRVVNEQSMAKKNMQKLKEEHHKLLVLQNEMMQNMDEKMSKENEKVKKLKLLSKKMQKRDKTIWNGYCQMYKNTIEGSKLAYFKLDILHNLVKIQSECQMILRWNLKDAFDQLDMICKYGEYSFGNDSETTG